MAQGEGTLHGTAKNPCLQSFLEVQALQAVVGHRPEDCAQEARGRVKEATFCVPGAPPPLHDGRLGSMYAAFEPHHALKEHLLKLC